MNLKMLEVIKRHSFKDAIEVEVFTGVKQRTLFNWYNDRPQSFLCMVVGASLVKKRLNLKEHEVERRKIEILTQEFIEAGGVVEMAEITDRAIK